MTLEALRKDMVAAMKAKDKTTKDAVSSLVSAVKKAAIDEGCREDVPEALVDRVVLKEMKTVKEQLENAKQEVVKPFPKEKELNQMMERLSELNALLNMDEQGSSEEPENSGKQSIHDKLNAIKQNGQQEHDHDKPAKGNDIDRS